LSQAGRHRTIRGSGGESGNHGKDDGKAANPSAVAQLLASLSSLCGYPESDEGYGPFPWFLACGGIGERTNGFYFSFSDFLRWISGMTFVGNLMSYL
jgi:hypothetical protein